jgi:CRP-like cAMP-binding protein
VTANSLHFGVDLSKVGAMGSLAPYSQEAMDAYVRHGLSSEDRLYYQLVSEMSLDSAAFMPQRVLCTAGQPVTDAYIVRQGELELHTEGASYRVGPGAVIGLAAGLADLPHNMTAVTTTVVTASVIPIFKALKAWGATHPGLRGINRNTLMRVLHLQAVPESLK